MGIAIGNQQIFLHKRDVEHTSSGEYAPRNMATKIISFLETGEGIFRSTQLGDRLFSFLHAVRPDPAFAGAAKLFNKCWTFTVIPHLPFVFREAKNAVVGASIPNDNPAVVQRNYLKAIREVATATALSGYAFITFSDLCKTTSGATLPVLQVAKAVNLVADASELHEQVGDLSKASSLVKRAKELNVAKELQENLVETKRFHALKTLKSVCAVGGFVLGLGLAAAGVAMLPASVAVLAGISLIGTIVACGSALYENGMRYQRVKFFDEKHVQPIVPVFSGKI